DLNGAGAPIPFCVVRSDQSLASEATETTLLLSEPGSRYDIVVDFKNVPFGSRVIMENIGGDEPFGGDLPGEFAFGETDRIMAFDVVKTCSRIRDTNITGGTSFSQGFEPNLNPVDRVRKVALFEGKDEYGRLQPLLGTAEPATDYQGNAIHWPTTAAYQNAGLTGVMEGGIGWHSPTTENPALNSTEIWEIYNGTGDAHPVHLHLVHFDILDRHEIIWDSHTNEEERTIPNSFHDEPAGDGTYKAMQPVLQHNGAVGIGFKFVNLTVDPNPLPQPEGYVENASKDMVTALPGQMTRIKATFDKPGRYVWHCHILSHEDHEMMRVLHVGEGAGGGHLAKGTGNVADSQPAAIAGFALKQNYPNPFNPSTNITFELPERSAVQLRIYDVTGREVRALSRGNVFESGAHTLVWDGRDKAGNNVSSGTYLYRIKAGNFVKSLLMQLVR
ncbi:MAG TPA: multicopper oxidase domain-containing protein, partial [Calditrichia bacterium]|nr:multicopper oxidase domain-containing protein [Calditrichia bacterium]